MIHLVSHDISCLQKKVVRLATEDGKEEEDEEEKKDEEKSVDEGEEEEDSKMEEEVKAEDFVESVGTGTEPGKQVESRHIPSCTTLLMKKYICILT